MLLVPSRRQDVSMAAPRSNCPTGLSCSSTSCHVWRAQPSPPGLLPGEPDPPPPPSVSQLLGGNTHNSIVIEYHTVHECSPTGVWTGMTTTCASYFIHVFVRFSSNSIQHRNIDLILYGFGYSRYTLVTNHWSVSHSSTDLVPTLRVAALL
jgi:hypothetical protein